MRIAFLVLLWQYGGCLNEIQLQICSQFSPKKFLKSASYIFLTIFKLKKTILLQVGHVFNIFESGLSHKQQESTSRPEIVSIAESLKKKEKKKF